MFDFIKKFAYVVTFIFVVYTGFQFGMPYYRYYAFRTDVADYVKFKYRNKDDISALKSKILEKALDLGIPISANHIKAEHIEGGYWVIVQWQETVDILGQYQKTLHFRVEAGK